ncbi:MAG: metallophosphoesterase [Actinobacteria bacterium]|nr:metallophosphoesterase [Actinomycetota bacterium]MCA1739048.1 metallophosphoesterase [Actinomycetota bacterium]
MLRIAHISDTHLGYTRYAKLDPQSNRNQREVDVQEAYGRAVDAILERDVDLVIHSGDVFDSVRPATHVIIGFLKQTARITAHAGIPYLVAAGNHETPRLRTTTAALEYANLVNVVSAHRFDLDYEQVEVGGVDVGVTLVPHGAVFGTGAVTPARDADINILVTHGMVPGLEARQHEMGEANLQSGMLEGGFDYVALGHYHEFHEHKPNAYYAGATERFGFGEVESRPGFAIVEFDGSGLRSVEHVEIEARPMLDLEKISARDMDSAELTETVRERTSGLDLDGAIMRLRVYDVRRGVASSMDRELLRDLQRRCLNFSLEIHPEERPEDLERDGSPTAVFEPLGEEFAAFVAARRERGELEAKFAEEFLEKGRGYLARAASEEPESAM